MAAKGRVFLARTLSVLDPSSIHIEPEIQEAEVLRDRYERFRIAGGVVGVPYEV